MKIVVFIICVISVFITNYLSFKNGLKVGMKYSLDKTYDIFMQAIYLKLKQEHKNDKESEIFMKDIHNLLNIVSDKIL